MSAKVDELTVAFSENGVVRVNELDKAVLQEGGGWATVAFLAEEVAEGDGVPVKRVHVRRYKKRGDAFHVHAKITLNSVEQAERMRDALARWFA